MEIFDIKTLIGTTSYISHLILESDRERLSAVVNAEGYKSEAVEITLLINGMEVRKVDLEVLLNDWTARLTAQELEKMGVQERRVALLSTEEGLIEKAKELAKEMCYEMAQKFEWN